MNKKLLKFLSFVLFLSLLITSIATGTLPVVAAEEAEVEHKAYAGEPGTVTEEPKAVAESDVVASGTWGGIDWTLTTDGTLTIAPTVNEITKTKPYSETNPKELYQVGEVPAAVNDAINDITGWPFTRTAVKKLVIEEGVTSIGSFALQGLTNLTGEVVIPSTVTYIGQEAFQKSPMTKLTFAKGGTGELCIGPGAFKTLAITELVLPEDRSSIHIHCWAFNGCSKLEKIVIPANVDFSSSKTYGWTHAEYNGMDYVYGAYAASSDIFATCPKITSIDFGSEEVKTNFFKMQGNQTTFNKLPNVTVEVKTPSVAQIGEQGFETLADALAAAQAGDTVTLLADSAENVTISKTITIDGAGKTFSGTMTVNGVGVTLTVKNATLKAAGSYVIYTKQSNVTIENCTLTSDATAANYYGSKALVKAEQAANSSIKISGCTVSNLYYPVYFTQGGTSLIIEDSTITDCVYLASAMKCANVTIKDVTYTGMAGIMVRNSIASTLALENVNITTTLNGQSPVAMMQPDSGSGVLYTITLNGENVANGAEMTVENEADWFARQNESNPYEIINLNRKPTGSVAYRADVTDKADREGIAILLKGVYAKESVVVKVYYNDTLMFTCTRRDIDDEGKVMFPVDGNTTANIVLWGKESGSWINEILVAPTEFNVPNKIEVYADGVLVDTYTNEAGTVLGTNLDKYLALDCVAKAVAQVGEAKYTTLAEAIKNATAGQTITFLADINENVTVSKSITIDGTGFKYTGTLTVNDNLTVTVQNVNFVNGGIAKTTKSAKGNYTIKGCTFTDNGKYAYALSFKGASNIIVENCAVSNYMYGFLYVSHGAVNVSVKNVTVENCSNYAVYFASGVNTASFEDLTVKNSNNGFILNNTANRAFTVNNCTMENVVTAINSSKGTNTITCTVLGVNDFGGAAISQYAKLVGAAQVGNVYYGDFAEAFAAAKDGDTIKLLGDIAIDTETFTVADGKKIVLDMNGKKITATDNKAANASYELFYIYGEMIVIGNGTIELTSTSNDTAWAKSSTIFHNRGGVLTIENGTFTHKGGTCMAFVVDNSGNWYGDAVTNINGGALNSSYIAIRNRMEQNTHGASGKAILNVSGGKIDGVSRAIWAQAASTSTNAPATGEINISGGTIGLIDTARSSGAVSMTTVNGGTVAAFKGESGELTVNGGKVSSISIYYEDSKTGEFVTTNYKVKKDNVYYAAVAKIGVKYFATLQDAVDAATSGQKIMLVANSKGEGVVINKSLTLDFYGYTYVLTSPVGSSGTETLGFQILAGGFDENRKPKNNVTVRAGTLKIAEEAADKFAILVQNYANLTVFGMKLDGTNLGRYENYSYVLSVNCGTVAVNGSSVLTAKEGEGNYALDVYNYSSAGYSLPKVTVTTAVKVNGKINAGAKYSATVYYATYEQAVTANGNSSKNIKNLEKD